MPSPPAHHAARCRTAPRESDGIGQPGLLLQMAFFVFANLVGLAQSQADIVETVQQTEFAERADLERERKTAVDGADGLFFQIDADE